MSAGEVADASRIEAKRQAVKAILTDLRDRRLLKYLFSEHADTMTSAYGRVEEPISIASQNEMVSKWVDIVSDVMDHHLLKG